MMSTFRAMLRLSTGALGLVAAWPVSRSSAVPNQPAGAAADPQSEAAVRAVPDGAGLGDIRSDGPPPHREPPGGSCFCELVFGIGA